MPHTKFPKVTWVILVEVGDACLQHSQGLQGTCSAYQCCQDYVPCGPKVSGYLPQSVWHGDSRKETLFAFLSIYYSESFFPFLKVSSIYWNIQENSSILHSLTQPFPQPFKWTFLSYTVLNSLLDDPHFSKCVFVCVYTCVYVHAYACSYVNEGMGAYMCRVVQEFVLCEFSRGDRRKTLVFILIALYTILNFLLQDSCTLCDDVPLWVV